MLYELEKFVSKKYGRPKYTKAKKNVSIDQDGDDRASTISCKSWSREEFPLSLLLEKVINREENENVLYGKFSSIDDMSAGELAKALHNLDLRLYGKVMPTEIVEYGKVDKHRDGGDESSATNKSDGHGDKSGPDQLNKETKEQMHNRTDSTQTISSNFMSDNLKDIVEKNKALTALTSIKISKGVKSSFFVRVCRYLKKRSNYNSIVSILNGLRTHKTSRSFNEFDIPKKYDPSTTFIIQPIENILADVAISNQETLSEGANMFFYGIVKFFIMLQDKKYEVDVEMEHAIMREMVSVKNCSFEEHEEFRCVFLGSYLFVPVRKNK